MSFNHGKRVSTIFVTASLKQRNKPWKITLIISGVNGTASFLQTQHLREIKTICKNTSAYKLQLWKTLESTISWHCSLKYFFKSYFSALKRQFHEISTLFFSWLKLIWILFDTLESSSAVTLTPQRVQNSMVSELSFIMTSDSF